MNLTPHPSLVFLISRRMSSMQQIQSFCHPIKFSIVFILVSIAIIACKFLNPWDRNPFSGIRFFRTNHDINKYEYDHSYGKWIWDETRPEKGYNENCPFLDAGFRCRRSGRRDSDYQKWRWKPHNCDLPSFNGMDLLERIRGGRIVFAGDSIGRNQWESLICMLAQGAASNGSSIYEENGSSITKHKGFLSIKFQPYNVTVQYYRTPYLVVIDRPPRDAPENVHGVIRVDKLHWFSRKWVGADVVVFSAGHWWNEDKTVHSGHYFQEGEKVNMNMDVMEAFRRSLRTLKEWASKELDPEKTVIFFRSYSPAHFRDGEWNNGGHCDHSLEPEMDSMKLVPEPLNNRIIYEAVEEMKIGRRRVKFLNITYLTELRKDGHPSRYREPGTPPNAPQDCSHWCLPGVPDTWNEIMYAELLRMGFSTRRK